MNLREQVRQEMGEEGVREFDRCKELQDALTDQLLAVVMGAMETCGDTKGKASAMALIAVLEATSAAYAGTIVAAHAALKDAHQQIDTPHFIQTALKSLIHGVNSGFEMQQAKEAGIADKIKAAAKKGATA